MDYISYTILFGENKLEDYLILNSTSMYESAIPVLNKYQNVIAFLDNDHPGRECFKKIKKAIHKFDYNMPRKKETITRSENIIFRVSPLEKKVIELAAKETNLSTSSFARKAALNMKVTLRFSPEEFNVYKDLQQYHRNFKSIGNLIRGNEPYKREKILTELNQVITLIKEHLKRFET